MLAFCLAGAGGDPALGFGLPAWSRTGGVVLELLFAALGVVSVVAGGRGGAEGAAA